VRRVRRPLAADTVTSASRGGRADTRSEAATFASHPKEGQRMDTLGIHHLGLAVADLKATAGFFTDCLGWQVAREVPEYPAIFVTNGSAFLTLWQTEPGAKPFDRRRNVGLHHFAIRVASEQALHDVFARASAWPGVAVEFAPELLRGGPRSTACSTSRGASGSNSSGRPEAHFNARSHPFAA